MDFAKYDNFLDKLNDTKNNILKFDKRLEKQEIGQQSYNDEKYDSYSKPNPNASATSNTSNELDIEEKNKYELDFEDGFEEDFEEEFNKKGNNHKEI